MLLIPFSLAHLIWWIHTRLVWRIIFIIYISLAAPPIKMNGLRLSAFDMDGHHCIFRALLLLFRLNSMLLSIFFKKYYVSCMRYPWFCCVREPWDIRLRTLHRNAKHINKRTTTKNCIFYKYIIVIISESQQDNINHRTECNMMG